MLYNIFGITILLLLQACAAQVSPICPRKRPWPAEFDEKVCEANFNPSQPRCRCFPGDHCWPSATEWADFNRTVGGRLIATIPLGASCYPKFDNVTSYDAHACATQKTLWDDPKTHYASSSSPMAAWFANDSCNPFATPSSHCVSNAYVKYAVNATGVTDFQATLAFATKNNIRLVIRNTGHDFFGKSTGAGALALWTLSLKDIEVIPAYSSKSYNGSALKLGAGVLGHEAFAAADAAGLAVTGGNCATVGMVGGFPQGGGLGPLTSSFGLAADQVLEWEVVTATGQHIFATPTQNKDLYYALSGGGGGTYAAVLSMTMRAHSSMRVASANLTFSSKGVSEESFKSVLETFLSTLPRLAEAGAYSSFVVIGGGFRLVPVFGPKLTASELQSLLNPTLDSLNKSGISYEYHINDFDTFLAAYNVMTPVHNVIKANIGGRLIPRTVLESHDSLTSLVDTFRFVTNDGGVVSGVVTNQTNFPIGDIQNSVSPALRNSLISVVLGSHYNSENYAANIALQRKMTDRWLPRLEALAPMGGSYLNEADLNQPNWQTIFYGNNYEHLRQIKDKYDPEEIFYGITAVGSDRWTYRMHTDGRLCRAV